MVFIQHDINEKVIYQLIDLNGQIVLERERESGHQIITLDVNRFPSGHYFLQVLSLNGTVITKKAVIVE